MNDSVEYVLNKASEADIAEHLSNCDADFIPALSSRVEINDYAKKITRKATRFEAWSGRTLVGMVAAYCNDQEGSIAYITSVSVLKAWKGKGIALKLLKQCIEHAKGSGMRQISLEVASDNMPAIGLYEKNGFVADKANAQFICMNLYLSDGAEHEQ
jgi:ribosomal protein S18 acetylase RimI-like enzyme